MSSALLASLSVWLLVTGPAVRRVRPAGARRVGGAWSPLVGVTVLVPVACVVVLGPVLGLAAAVAATPAARAAVGTLETATARRRRAAVERALPAALDLVVAVLDAGRPPVQALALAAEVTPGPLADELAGVAARLAVGADPSAVWTSLAEDPALAPVGRALGRAEESGMPVARVVAGVAAELRRARRAAARERSRGVGVRTAAPLGLCFLPAFFLVGIVPTVIGVVGTLDLVP